MDSVKIISSIILFWLVLHRAIAQFKCEKNKSLGAFMTDVKVKLKNSVSCLKLRFLFPHTFFNHIYDNSGEVFIKNKYLFKGMIKVLVNK